MFLALREMRRARTRFLLLIAAIGLLVFLILTQQAIQNGLITAFVGAIERQSAPVLVFSVDSQRTLQGSVIAPALERQIRAVPGIAGAGRIGQSTFTVRLNNRTGDSDSAVIGYDRADLGAPDTLSAGRLPRARGEAVGSSPDYALGDRVRAIGAGGTRGPLLTVVGLAEDAQLQVTPTLFVRWADYVSTVRATNPDAGCRPPERPGRSPDPRPLRDRARHAHQRRQRRRRRADPRARRAEVAGRGPGAPVLPGDLPALRARRPAGDRAVLPHHHLPEGRPPSRSCARSEPTPRLLVRSLMVQVVLVVAGGLAVGDRALRAALAAAPRDIALRFESTAVAFWAVLLLVLGR